MSVSHSAPELISSGHKLLEAPLFHAKWRLMFTDAEVGGVWALADDGRLTNVIPYRRGIGGIAMHESGGLIVSGRNVALKTIPNGETIILLDNNPQAGHVGFNDLVTDRQGRLYVGSLAYVPMLGQHRSDRKGALHLIDLDGRVRQVADGIRLSNGLGFSPDGSCLYYADTDARCVYAFDVAPDGSLSSQRHFVALDGMPDGLAVAEDGSVWVAVVHSGLVLRYDRGGNEIDRIPFPTPMITSLCFGGDDGMSLYVVSGEQGAVNGLDGCIFRLRTSVAGVPRHPARIVPH